MQLRFLTPILACVLFGCPPDSDPEPAPPEIGDPVYCPSTVGGEREAAVVCPAAWTDEEQLPVVVLLHGYGAWASAQDLLWRLSARVELDRFALILPEGLVDSEGSQYWNATPACCDNDGTEVDDVGHLLGLVDELAAAVPADLDRVYFTGHSNGGFMSYRMACDAPDRVAAIAPLAGSSYLTAEECAVGDPVPVLHMHGTADTSVPYEGRPGDYPSAPDTVARWAERAGCDLDAATVGEPLDLTNEVDGAETAVLRYEEGCDEGIDVVLWTIQDGDHVPVPNDTFSAEVVRFLMDHSL